MLIGPSLRDCRICSKYPHKSDNRGLGCGVRRSYSSAPPPILSSSLMPDRPNLFTKQYMLTAGPTPLPPKVSQVMAEPILYHRAPAFVEIYARVLERLPRVFAT